MRNTTDIINMRKWKFNSMSDEGLMEAYAKGDSDAFECLYLRHKSTLFSFLRRQCNNTAIAEELAHDTWLAVINQATVYQSSAKFKTWAYRIAHNRLVDHWRKHGSSAQALFDELSNHVNSRSEDTNSRNLEISELFKSLEILSAEQTEALLLKIEGFTLNEIAEVTNAKHETVKSRLRYATQHLRVAMEVTS